jgi:hypothetical protein
MNIDWEKSLRGRESPMARRIPLQRQAATADPGALGHSAERWRESMESKLRLRRKRCEQVDRVGDHGG